MSSSKFTVYAVKKGRQTGLYKTWADCEKQVKGFFNPEFKGFATVADAQHWLDGTRPKLEDGKYHVFCDGSCIGNPGKGGVAFLVYKGNEFLHKDAMNGWPLTTNNRMELEAVLFAMRWVYQNIEHDSQIILWADSTYMIGALRGVGHANADLLAKVSLIPKHFPNLKVMHIDGHTGSYFSDEVDKMAQDVARKEA